ncbi:MAG: hypothetical protein AABZ77_03630 [Chloroflexota bacterium]
MARCPNCGREAARTIDWVCQWCGYPLPDGSFKKIDKTFRELKEENLSPQSVSEEVEAAPGVAPEPVRKPEPVSKLKPESARKPELVSKPKVEPVKRPEPSSPPEPVRSQEPAPDIKAPIEDRPPEPIIQPLPVVKTDTVSEVKATPPPEVQTEPAPVDMELTVADLLLAYETDGVAADARFTNKILKITGIIDKINVKDALNIYSITLNSPKKSLLLQGARCVFDRNYGHALNSLSMGQTVTVQGRYTGSMVDISLRDCFLAP